MNRSRLLMIGGLAIAVGLLVSFSVYNRLRNLAGSTGNGNGHRVLVAARDIAVGVKLDTPDVATVMIPEAAVPPGSFSDPAKVLGRGAILPVSKGEFLLNNKLAAVNAGAGLPSLIPPGMRAVSVRVNDVVSVAGFVQPGSRVDVLATGAGGGNDRATTTVLENIAVIAVGKSLDRNAPAADTQAAPVITLLVSPDDAQKLALASGEGRIQLSLRNPLDTRQASVEATRTSSLYPGGKPAETEPKPKVRRTVVKAAPAAPPAPYAVEMIRGSKRDETKFQDDKR